MALDYYGPNDSMGTGLGYPSYGLPPIPTQYGATGIPGEVNPSSYGPPAMPPGKFSWDRYNESWLSQKQGSQPSVALLPSSGEQFGPEATAPKSSWERYQDATRPRQPADFQGPSGVMAPPVSAPAPGEQYGPDPASTVRSGLYDTMAAPGGKYAAPPPAPLSGLGSVTQPGQYGPAVQTSPAPSAASPATADPPGTVTPPGRLSQAQLDAQWDLMVPGESGGNPNAKNPHSSASGLGQFTDATRDRFLASPEGAGLTKEDYKNSPAVQRKAFDWLTQDNNTALLKAGMDSTPESRSVAHALGAGGAVALMSAPGENAVKAYDAKVPGSAGKGALITGNPAWGITPTDTAAEASTKIAAYYARNAQSAGGSSGGTQSASADPSKIAPDPGKTLTGSSDAIPAQVGFGPGPLGPNGIPPGMSPDYTPLNPSDKMLAFAGGIGRGKNLADGIGLGIQDMQKLSSDDQEQRYKIMQQAAATNYTNQHALLADAQIPAVGARVEQGNRALDLKGQALDVREQQLRQQNDLAQQRADSQRQRVNIAQSNADFKNSGEADLNKLTVRDSMQANTGLTNDVVSAGDSLQKISDLQATISKEGLTGNDVRAKIARFAANDLGINIGVTPTGYSLGAKQIADFSNGTVLTQAKGVIGRFTNGEFNALKDGVLNMGTNPEAALAMLETYKAAAQRRLDIGMQWHEKQTNDPAGARRIMMQQGGLRNWYEDKLGGQFASRGISSDPNTSAPSQYTPTDTGWTTAHTPNGSSVRYREN